MPVYEDIIMKRDLIRSLADRHGAYDLYVFGSVARGEETPDSDIDMLASFQQGRSYFDLIGLKTGLEEILKTKVDLLTPKSLHWSLRDRAERDKKPI